MSKANTIIISGAGGQLGQAFQKYASLYDQFEFKFFSRAELNILNGGSIQNALKTKNLLAWINCAAYTKVDLAEDEPDLASAINAEAVKNIARACEDKDVQLIHFSSDYVYHLDVERPLLETDPCQPQSQYAKSKRKGEEYLLAESGNHVIIRTSWLYGPTGQNFVKTILNLAKKRDELRIVDDQLGAPTSVLDLSRAVLEILSKTQSDPTLQAKWKGIFNYANKGMTNWYSYALEILRIAQLQGIKVIPISSETFNAKAPRPKWSLMSTDKIQNYFGLEIPFWKTSLQDCMEEIVN